MAWALVGSRRPGKMSKAFFGLAWPVHGFWLSNRIEPRYG